MVASMLSYSHEYEIQSYLWCKNLFLHLFVAAAAASAIRHAINIFNNHV